ncbi:hypothetical protein [Bacillus salipaludis]|uniref:Uncharacterized protein n=1 Tax=Bacillus salipaludis TaxID=2547811 RepID=A0AA90QZ73_9BACI|nr:hypothetical protein [Bacillus salipaludis]MDQ6597922.1 hypothetical protein [Bacillus salipaludis]
MRLRNGDFYTNVFTNKLYRLNEDKDSSWYLSLLDEEGYHETEKISGRDMIIVPADFFSGK